jgi:hypothetical protein
MNGRLSNVEFTQALLPHEVLQLSTHREMSAVLKILLCFKRELRITSPTMLWWLTDSKNVARIFQRGSGGIVLMRLALQVLELALELNLDLNTIWVSRSDPR